MPGSLSQSERDALARSVRGNAEVWRCHYCRVPLERPASEGRHSVACPACHEVWHVVVLGNRMIAGRLTDDQITHALGKAWWGCLFLFLMAVAGVVAMLASSK